MGGIYRRKNIVDNIHTYEQRTNTLETETKVPLVSTSLTQELTYQFQATSFSGIQDQGEIRVNNTTTPTSTIDEETNATVAAYAVFDDLGGNGAASADVFDGTLTKIPLLDGEGRTAYYRGHPSYIAWDDGSKHPTVSHTGQFLGGHSVKLNVPGTVTNDQKAFVYYDSHANFNISVSTSVALWFYPTDLNVIGSETFRFLLYRYIDASNYYMICVKSSDKKVYVFVDEAGATTKLVSNAAVNLNAWNLIIFTYNPSTNALVIYLNNVSTSSTPGDAVPTLYTTNTNLYVGGLPGLPDKRYTGYLDNFVLWNIAGKILSSGEAGNMWNHGTII